MSDKYILDGHKAKRCGDLMKWAMWYEDADRRVAETVVDGRRVSTVFIGLDHQFGEGPPLIFETMIFGDYNDGEYQTRCSTWEEAEEMHRVAVASLTPARNRGEAMKLTEAKLAEIRERDARAQEAFENFYDQARVADDDRHALLLHIAATQADGEVDATQKAKADRSARQGNKRGAQTVTGMAQMDEIVMCNFYRAWELFWSRDVTYAELHSAANDSQSSGGADGGR